MTSTAAQIQTLRALADEMAAARRWTEAKAIQTAIMALQAYEAPVADAPSDVASYVAIVTQ